MIGGVLKTPPNRPNDKPAQPGRRSVLVLTLGTRGGIDRQMQYLIGGAGSAIPDWSFTTFDTHGSRWRSIVTLPAKLYRFSNLLKQGHYTLCHVNLAPRGSTWRKSIYCAICETLGVPYVLHLHGSNYHEFFRGCGRWRQAFIRRLFRRAARVIVLGEFWRDFVATDIGIAVDKISLLANAVPGPQRLPLKARVDPPVILFLGIVGKRKGVDVLLEALASPGLQTLPWSAVVAGDGEVAKYAERSRGLGLAERVMFTGWCDEQKTQKLLSLSSVLVLPSRGENLPLSLLEGMAHGLCPVATPVGAVPEVIADGSNGLLVPVGDASALADALVRVLRVPNDRHRIAAAARATYLMKYDVRDYPHRMRKAYQLACSDQTLPYDAVDDAPVQAVGERL